MKCFIFISYPDLALSAVKSDRLPPYAGVVRSSPTPTSAGRSRPPAAGGDGPSPPPVIAAAESTDAANAASEAANAASDAPTAPRTVD